MFVVSRDQRLDVPDSENISLSDLYSNIYDCIQKLYRHSLVTHRGLEGENCNEYNVPVIETDVFTEI